MNQKLLALYGLKWNPFSPELPTEAIYVAPKMEDFCWRIEHAQIREVAGVNYPDRPASIILAGGGGGIFE